MTTSSRESRIRVLVGYANYTDRLSYYDDWLDAFATSPHFDAVPFDIVPAEARERLPALLGEVDAVVLLHSTNGDTTDYLEPHAATLAGRKVPLLTFVGNEVSLPGSPIAEKRHLFSLFRPDIVATQLLPEAGQYLFGDVAGRVVAIPHALNPAAYRPLRAAQDRPIDVGARAVRYLAHLGDDDRNRILDWFRTQGPGRGLAIDISDGRFDRTGWADFLNRSKATVATEAGTWFLERDDATVNAIRDYILSRSGSAFVIRNDSALRTLGHKLPGWARDLARKVLRHGPLRHEALVNEAVDPAEIHARFFAGRERPAINGKCISSRHFDAAGTRTCQIMFPGRFNDILVADEHYLALEPDFSNIDDVLRRFADPDQRGAIVDRLHALVLDRHTYANRMETVARCLVDG
ncbi:glycosyltransferase [uncultured Alsobacter sp.]|uniref:glycosyltransferase family protein n=1 Tax=uncultured Alsobacter sp. TaxID=1748258 RepID=UPI0025D505AA|nr:glycosyltransferase [uncultured Alsobacter sp.]